MSVFSLTPIGDLVTPVSSWTPERDDPDGELTYIDLSAVSQDAKAIASPRQVACSDAPSRARQLARTDDVLVSTVRPNLNAVARVPSELDGATASTGFCVLRPIRENIDSSFLLHWVRTPRFVAEMVRRATGASYPAVSDRIILESKIPLLPIAEQQRIAAILDKADALRAKRRATLAQLDTLTQSIFLDMFGDPATNPKDWPIELLKNCTEKIQIGPFGSLLHKEDYVSGGIHLVNPKHIQDGLIKIGNESVTESKYARLSAYHLRPNDVVMGRRGEMGRCAIVEETLGHLLCGTGSLFIRPDNLHTHSQFLFAILSSASSKRKLEKLSLGQTLPNLNAKIVEQFEIPLPPINLQLDFSERISALKTLAVRQQASQSLFQNLFASLQSRAFRGEL